MADTGYCRYFIQDQGCRNGNRCTFSHNADNVPMCRYWQDKGSCPRNQTCWFRHGDISDYKQKLKQRHEEYSEFAAGSLGTGSNKHSKVSTRRQKQQPRGGAARGKPSGSRRGNSATNNAAELLVGMVMSRAAARGSDSDSSYDGIGFPDDLVENDIGLYHVKAAMDVLAINASPPGSDDSMEQEMMEAMYGCDGDEEEEDFDSSSGDEEVNEPSKPAAQNKSKKIGEKLSCNGSNCKRVANRKCSNSMCKLCCIMQWPTVCRMHDMLELKDPVDKYLLLDKNMASQVDKSVQSQEIEETSASIPVEEINGANRKKTGKKGVRNDTVQSFSAIGPFKTFIANMLVCEKVVDLGFGGSFGIQDEHILDVARCCPNLKQLSLGDTDSGDGTYLTDAAIVYLVHKCPQLTKLSLISCTGLTDYAVLEVFKKCANIGELTVTGHDKSDGRVKGLCLLSLIKDSNLAKHLRKLDFDAQLMDYALVNKFKRQRRHVRLSNNEVWGDGMGQMMVRREMYGGGWNLFDLDDHYY